MSRDCTNPSNNRSNNGNRNCHICKEEGHQSRNCPKKVNDNNGDNNGNSRYNFYNKNIINSNEGWGNTTKASISNSNDDWGFNSNNKETGINKADDDWGSTKFNLKNINTSIDKCVSGSSAVILNIDDEWGTGSYITQSKETGNNVTNKKNDLKNNEIRITLDNEWL